MISGSRKSFQIHTPRNIRTLAVAGRCSRNTTCEKVRHRQDHDRQRNDHHTVDQAVPGEMVRPAERRLQVQVDLADYESVARAVRRCWRDASGLSAG
jgi:hypothetical protein